MDPVAYKALHESFMTNHNGTGAVEVFATIAPSFLYPFLTVSLLAALPHELPVPARFLLEFVAIVWTVVLDVTVLHSRIYEINATLWFVVATIVAKHLFNRTHVLPFVNQIPVRRPEFVACLRATTSLITAVCILAVDFRAFPRKLAKTETYGFALMDTGVGLFVFSNALVDDVLWRGKHDVAQLLSAARVKKLLTSTSVLFALGALRWYSIKEINYQEHTSEYGVHWNFFFTLAVTRIIATVVMSFLPKLSYAKVASVCIVVGHQLTLQLGLADWVTNVELNRDTLLTANREGIVSIPGYVGLYLACIYLGSILMVPASSGEAAAAEVDSATTEVCTANQLAMRALRVAIHALIAGKLAFDCQHSFGVSRRLADMGYVLSIFAIASAMTALFMLLEVFYHVLVFQKARSTSGGGPTDGATTPATTTPADISRYCPMVLSAINYNGMAFFLAANLMTGLVNVTFQTLLVDTAGCVFIVSTYMFVLCSIMTFLYVNEIRLKL